MKNRSYRSFPLYNQGHAYASPSRHRTKIFIFLKPKIIPITTNEPAEEKAEEDMTQANGTTNGTRPATTNYIQRYRHLDRLLDLYRMCEDVEGFAQKLKELGGRRSYDIIVAAERRTEEIMPLVSPDVIVEAYIKSDTDEDFEDTVTNVHWGKNYKLLMEDWVYESPDSSRRRSRRLRRSQ